MTAFFLGIFLFFLSIAGLYLCALGAASFLIKPDEYKAKIFLKYFAIVVPAHNEEHGLQATLFSITGLDYPRNLFEVIVVADNCSDGTAELARRLGVRCIERNDMNRRGKGFALAFAFERLLMEKFDAFIILDADNVISSNFLKVMSARLQYGQLVVQSRNTVQNPLRNALTWILAVGNSIENVLYCAGKARFGLSSPLRGTGMCFSRDILTKFPWDANSVAEDTEYGLRLVQNGQKIYFSEESEVMSDAPTTLDMLLSQRIRWASGNMHLARKSTLHLMLSGIRNRDINLLDSGWSMLIRSKPLLLASAFFVFLFSLIAQEWIIWSSFVLLLWVSYFGVGLWVSGISRQSLRLTLASPFYLFWLVGVAICGVAGFRRRQWVRTGRK